MKVGNILFYVLFIALVSSVAEALPQTARVPKDPQFRIGFVYPRTGPLAPFGQSLSEGVRLGLEKFREENPQMGARIGIVVADDGGLASQAEKAAARLIEVQKVAAIIGSVTNTINQSIAGVASKTSTPLLLPQGTDEDLLSDPNTFSLSLTDRRQGQLLARFALRQLKRTKAALVIEDSAPDGTMIAKGFTDGFAKGGGELLGEWRVETSSSSRSKVLAEIRQTQADLVVCIGSYRTAGPLMEEAQKQGIKASWIGSDGWDHPSLFDARPNLSAHYYFSYFHRDDPHEGVQSFVADYEVMFGRKPDLIAAHGYEAIRAIIQAYTLTQSTDGAMLSKAFEGARFGGIYGAGRFAQDRVYLRAAPFLTASGGQLRFSARTEPED